MVPPDFANFFVASTSAGAALVGLLFVAITVAPESTVMGGAPAERRAVASSSFTALLNAFFISLSALLPHSNIAYLTLVMGSLGFLNSLLLGLTVFREHVDWQAAIRRVVLVLTSLVIYGFEVYYAVLILLSPNNSGYVFVIATLVMGVYGVGVIRAWQLIGVDRISFLSWLNPLYELNKKRSLKSGNDRDKKAV